MAWKGAVLEMKKSAARWKTTFAGRPTLATARPTSNIARALCVLCEPNLPVWLVQVSKMLDICPVTPAQIRPLPAPLEGCSISSCAVHPHIKQPLRRRVTLVKKGARTGHQKVSKSSIPKTAANLPYKAKEIICLPAKLKGHQGHHTMGTLHLSKLPSWPALRWSAGSRLLLPLNTGLV